MTLIELRPVWAVSVPALMVVAALASIFHRQRSLVVTLLSLALLAALMTMWLTLTAGVLGVDLFVWLPLFGGLPPLRVGLRLDLITTSLMAAISVLSLGASSGRSVAPLASRDVHLLLVGAMASLVVIGDGPLAKLPAVEGLMLVVYLGLANRRSLPLLVTQRLVGACLLLAIMLPLTQADDGTASMVAAALMVVAALVLGGAVPFHCAALPVLELGAVDRAHLSGMLLVVAGALALSTDIALPVADTGLPWAFWFAALATVGAVASLACRRLRLAQLWSWSSQFGFVIVVALCLGAVPAMAMLLCLALSRPAAVLAIDAAYYALGDDADDPRCWGGLAGPLPVAWWLGVIAVAALAGLPPFGLFTIHALLLDTVRPDSPLLLLLVAVPALISVPALRLALSPFVSTSRREVLAIRQHTEISTPVAVVAMGCGILGLILPSIVVVNHRMPSSASLLMAAAVAVILGLSTYLICSRRPRPAIGEDKRNALRTWVGEGMCLPWPSMAVSGALQRLRWAIDLLALVPALGRVLLQALAWSLTWLESRPGWWFGAAMAGVAVAVYTGMLR